MEKYIYIGLAAYYIVINIIGYTLMYSDKKRARRGEWRISEASLFTVALLFGALGSTIGMWKFQSIMIKIFMIFGKGILALSIFGFVVGALSAMAGIEIFEEITPIKEAFIIIGNMMK